MLKCWQSCPDRNAAFGWVSAQLPSFKTHDYVLAISHHSKRELDKKRLYTSNKDRNCTEFMQCITRKTKALKKNAFALSHESGLYEWGNWKSPLPEEGEFFYIIQKMSCLPTYPIWPLICASFRQKGQLPSAARGSCHKTVSQTDLRSVFITQQISVLHTKHHMVLPDCTYSWLGFEESIIWHPPANDSRVTPG